MKSMTSRQHPNKPVYMVLGHGSEQVTAFSDRYELPTGCTVVMLTTIGNPLVSKHMTKLIGAFGEELTMKHAAMFENPIKHKKTLNDLINNSSEKMKAWWDYINCRVYTEGSKVPNHYTTLEIAWNSSKLECASKSTSFEAEVAKLPKSQTKFRLDACPSFCKSGIYKLGYLPKLNLELINALITHCVGYEQHHGKTRIDVLDNSYSDFVTTLSMHTSHQYQNGIDNLRYFIKSSLYKEITRGAVKTNAIDVSYEEQLQISPRQRFSIQDIIEMNGKGIYYIVSCRSVNIKAKTPHRAFERCEKMIRLFLHRDFIIPIHRTQKESEAMVRLLSNGKDISKEEMASIKNVGFHYIEETRKENYVPFIRDIKRVLDFLAQRYSTLEKKEDQEEKCRLWSKKLDVEFDDTGDLELLAEIEKRSNSQQKTLAESAYSPQSTYRKSKRSRINS